MKNFAKQFVRVNRGRKKASAVETLILLVIGLFSATSIAMILNLSPKSKKIIVSTISKDTKNTIYTMRDKSDKVKKAILQGYKNINRDVHKAVKKISN